MSNKKLTLVIDGNYFGFSRLLVLPRPKQIPGLPPYKFLTSKEEQAVFMRKLAIDFSNEVRKLDGLIDDIIFVLDSNSWRKDFFPKADYKGNREYKDDIDWKIAANILNTFKDIIEKKGVITSKVNGAEGDDLLFAWSSVLNELGRSVLFLTGDEDMMQLVHRNPSFDAMNLLYDNARGKFAGYPGFKNWLEKPSGATFDMFGKSNDSYEESKFKDTLKSFIAKNVSNYREVYCDEFVLRKILEGDKGDNIPSVHSWLSKKGTRTYKFTGVKIDKLLEIFKKRHGSFKSLYLFEDEYKREIVEIIERIMKNNRIGEKVLKQLELNINLVLLHSNIIPDVIQDAMLKSIELSLKFGVVPDFKNMRSLDNLLAGTEYISKDFNKNNKPSSGAIGLF